MKQQTNAFYADLSRCMQKNDYSGVIKAANEILGSKRDDINAIQCKIVALAKLDRFEDTLEEFGKFPEVTKKLNYVKAYTLYRLNRLEEALEIVEDFSHKNGLHYQELKAQIYYRLEKFKECYDLYQSLIKQTADEYDAERKTNYLAVIANLINLGKIIDICTICPDIKSAESYEILFNTACCLIYLNKFNEAELYLLEAEKQCLESFEEDATVIRTQLACCKHFQKKYSQALNIYKELLNKKPDDIEALAVCTNNTLGLNKNSSFFELKRKIKILQSKPVMRKLTSLQKRIICTNIYQVIALNSQNKKEALNICDILKHEHPESLDKATLLNAAIFVKNKNVSDAISVLDNFQSSGKQSLVIVLAKAQLYLSEDKYSEACDTLRLLGDRMFDPGIVSTLVTIMTGLGDTVGVFDLLVSAGEWMKKNINNTGALTALWEYASELHLKRGNSDLAVHFLEELLKIKPCDRTIISKLVIAYAKTNPSKSNEFCKLIRSDHDLKQNVDVSYLEKSTWMMGLKPIKNYISGLSQESYLKSRKSLNIKKRRKRLPKNYDPLVAPDPQRWLPMRERSYFKKKKKHYRNKGMGKGTQGGSPSTADQFDITKMSSQTRDKNISLTPIDSHKVYPKLQRKKKKGHKR